MSLENKLIFSISMVKNEEDIIESFVRYNINIFDGMIILDNGSSDKTLEILELLKDEGLPLYIFESDTPKFDQFVMRNKLLLMAVNEFNADLIVPLDADEFIISTNRGNPRKIIEKFGSNMLTRVKWKTFVPDFSKDKEVKFIPSKITMARDESLEAHYKVIVPKELVRDYNAKLSTGCHDLIYDEKYEKLINRIICPELRISHFPIRSKDQTFSKIVIGWINELHREDRIEGQSFHWQKIFDRLKDDEEITNEDVVNFAKEYALRNNELDVDIYNDPVDLSFCKNLNITYTPDHIKPLSNLLETFEYLSISHLNYKNKSKDEIRCLNETIKNLSIKLDELTDEKDFLKHKISEYETSTSWKITSPIRKVKDITRNRRD
jgi:hypothetical protein